MFQSFNSSRSLFNQPPPPPKPPNPCAATITIDRGTSGHYLVTSPHHTKASHPGTHPITMQLLNGSKIVSSHTTTIPLPELPSAARHAHVFPDLTNHSLISVGQLCDHGCKALFTVNHMVISKDGKPILTSNRSPNGLWTVSLDSSPAFNVQANLVYNQLSLHAELVQFLHASLFRPATSTLLQAITNNHLTTWPSLSSKTVHQHLPKSIAMAKGHLDQQ